VIKQIEKEFISDATLATMDYTVKGNILTVTDAEGNTITYRIIEGKAKGIFVVKK
jgi:hypothetical protein